MKTCTSCGKEQSLDQFYPHERGKHGVGSCCKTCTRAQKRQQRRDSVLDSVGMRDARVTRANRTNATTRSRRKYDEGVREVLKAPVRSSVPDSFEIETGIRGFKDWHE